MNQEFRTMQRIFQYDFTNEIFTHFSIVLNTLFLKSLADATSKEQ